MRLCLHIEVEEWFLHCFCQIAHNSSKKVLCWLCWSLLTVIEWPCVAMRVHLKLWRSLWNTHSWGWVIGGSLRQCTVIKYSQQADTHTYKNTQLTINTKIKCTSSVYSQRYRLNLVPPWKWNQEQHATRFIPVFFFLFFYCLNKKVICFFFFHFYFYNPN